MVGAGVFPNAADAGNRVIQPITPLMNSGNPDRQCVVGSRYGLSEFVRQILNAVVIPDIETTKTRGVSQLKSLVSDLRWQGWKCFC